MKPTLKRRIEVSCDATISLVMAAEWLESFQKQTEILIIGPTAEAADDLY
jgi:hypothetical protein